MKRNFRLFFSEQEDGSRDHSSLRYSAQNNYTQEPTSDTEALLHYQYNPIHCYAALNESLGSNGSTLLGRNENCMLINQRVKEDLSKISTDHEKLDYIKNIPYMDIEIIAEAIIEKLNSLQQRGIKKINNITILELLILARYSPYVTQLAGMIGLNYRALVSKLLSIGLKWEDLAYLNPEPIVKLSARYYQTYKNATSCLDQSIKLCANSREKYFDLEKNLDALIVQFATEQTVKDIAQKFCIRDGWLAKNYSKIIDLLKTHFEFTSSIENEAINSAPFWKIKLMCELIHENKIKRKNCSNVVSSAEMKEHINTQYAFNEEDDLLTEIFSSSMEGKSNLEQDSYRDAFFQYLSQSNQTQQLQCNQTLYPLYNLSQSSMALSAPECNFIESDESHILRTHRFNAKNDYKENDDLLEEGLSCFVVDNEERLLDEMAIPRNADGQLDYDYKEDALLEEALSLFTKDSEEQLFDKLLGETIADSKSIHKEDEFENALVYFAGNYPKFSHNLHMALEINEGFLEKLSAIFIIEELLTKSTHNKSSYKPGLFVDKTVDSSSNELENYVSTNLAI